MFNKLFLMSLFGVSVLFGNTLAADTFYYTENEPIEGSIIDVSDANHALVVREKKLIIVDMKDGGVIHDLGVPLFDGTKKEVHFYNSVLSNRDRVVLEAHDFDGNEYYVWSPN